MMEFLWPATRVAICFYDDHSLAAGQDYGTAAREATPAPPRHARLLGRMATPGRHLRLPAPLTGVSRSRFDVMRSQHEHFTEDFRLPTSCDFYIPTASCPRFADAAWDFARTYDAGLASAAGPSRDWQRYFLRRDAELMRH